MKFEGVLLKPLDQQQDRDGLLIDPAGVQFPDIEYGIFDNFDYTVPDSVLGTGRVHRQEDGALVVVGELRGEIDRRNRLAVGVRADKIQKPGVLTACELFAVSLTENHQDPTQPPIKEFQMNIVRLGHYHVPTGPDDAGYCQTALVVGLVAKVDDVDYVNLAVWESDGDQLKRLNIPVVSPLHDNASFHLSTECPWHR